MHRVLFCMAVISVAGCFANGCESEGQNILRMKCEANAKIDDKSICSSITELQLECYENRNIAPASCKNITELQMECYKSDFIEEKEVICKNITALQMECYKSTVINKETVCKDVTDAFGLACILSGGHLDRNYMEICRCGDQVCSRYSICDGKDEALHCANNADCYSVNDVKCENDNNGIGVKYKCSETYKWVLDGNCDNGVSCNASGLCGDCKNDDIRCCTDSDNDVCGDAYRIKYKQCRKGKWFADYCPGDYTCKNDKCGDTDLCDDDSESLCINDNNGIGRLQACLHGGRSNPMVCSDSNDLIVSCKDMYKCGDCLNNNRICQKTELSNNSEISLYESKICKNGEYLSTVCPNGCDENNPDVGCFCEPGNYQYLKNPFNEYEYRVCRGVEWKMDKLDYAFECIESNDYLFLNPIQDSEMPRITLPRALNKVTAYKNHEIIPIDTVKCDLFSGDNDKVLFDELVFNVYSPDNDLTILYDSKCIDTIIDMRSADGSDRKRKNFYVTPEFYRGSFLKFITKLDDAHGSVSVRCNSNHTGVHGFNRDTGYVSYDVDVYDMWVDGDIKSLQSATIVSNNVKYNMECHPGNTGVNTLCDFYICDNDVCCNRESTDSACNVYINLCVDAYSEKQSKTSYLFKSVMGVHQNILPRVCHNGCNADWTDCAD